MRLPEMLASFNRDTYVWLAVTLSLGGPAAFAAGRAVARAWRGRGLAVFYAALLAAATCLLCYSLFQTVAISLSAIARDAIARDPDILASDLAVWGASFVVLAIFALAGWRFTRARLMREQYGFSAAPDAPAGTTAEPDLRA